MSNYIYTNDERLASEDELYHYGVPGMKWGKRKRQGYENKADAYAKRAEKAKTGYGKRAYIRKEAVYRAKADKLKRIADAKTFKDALNEYSGDRNTKAVASARSNMYSKMASTAKTKLGQAMYTQESRNHKELSKYYDIRDKQSYGKKWFDSHVFNTTYAKMPYHRLSGRTTTVGKEVADMLLTGGLYGLAKDVQYKRSQKK